MPKLKDPFDLETIYSAYRITEQIGEGGAGIVFGGIDDDDAPVAVKVLPAAKSNASRRKRFKNETSFLSTASHRNLVRVIDHGIASTGPAKGPYYVMPRYASNLRQRMTSKISADEVLPLFGQALDGVEAAHFLGATHRDLKPENVLVDEAGKHLVIADFGIASFSDIAQATLVETKAGERLANFRYAAPEQRTPGAVVSSAADIFALGLILNEMVTGQVPQGTNYASIGSVHTELAFLDAIVDQMIQQNADKRPKSILEVKKLIASHRAAHIVLQRLSKTQRTVVTEDEIDDPLAFDPPNLVKVDLQGRTLLLYLDRPITDRWVQAMYNAPVGAILNHGPRTFTWRGSEVFTHVPIPSEQIVQGLVNHFKTWLGLGTKQLLEELKEETAKTKFRRQRELEQQRDEDALRLSILKNVKI